MAISRGRPASIRSAKRKKAPKRRKDAALNLSPEERTAPGRVSGLSSNPNLDIEISPDHKKRKPPNRNFLPKINRSVVVKASKKKRDLSAGSEKLSHSPSAKPKKKKRRPKDDFKVKLDTSESDDLGEIKEARMASRRAIDMLMADMKKRQ